MNDLYHVPLLPLSALPRKSTGRWNKVFGGYLSVLMASFFFSGCSEETSSVLGREQMWEWVGHRVHVGMPLDEASALLEKEGFSCTSHSKTATKIVDINKTATEGVFDFVKCEREDGSPPIKRHWEITLVREGKSVKLIGVRYRDVYPHSADSGQKAGS